MIRAFVLIEMKSETIKSNVKKLRKKRHIKFAYSVAGPYDVIGMIDVRNYRDISRIVAEDIHTLPGVLKTTTLLAFE